jgi:putative two-component system response regulator
MLSDQISGAPYAKPIGRAEIKSLARILIVDDEPANVLLLRKMLTDEGYLNVYTTYDSLQAFELVATHGIDLILLDLCMPNLDGFQVMSQLTALAAPPAILVLTAQTDYDLKIKALVSGARDFLTKPFDFTELAARVHNLLEAYLLNKCLDRMVAERTRELHDTRLEIIRRLGQAAEFRDYETGMHTMRMSNYCRAIGSAYGLSDDTCDLLLNASPMHDIGKIGIADSILLKPGKLTPAEFEIMKTHADIGGRLLEGHPSPLMEMAGQIALGHHEKWDGSGYPKRLSGEDIPVVCRIVAVSDVFDALTSERPYKKAWTLDAAAGYITEQRGRHFDPTLVEVFNDVLPDLLAIRKQYTETDSLVDRNGSEFCPLTGT